MATYLFNKIAQYKLLFFVQSYIFTINHDLCIDNLRLIGYDSKCNQSTSNRKEGNTMQTIKATRLQMIKLIIASKLTGRKNKCLIKAI